MLHDITGTENKPIKSCWRSLSRERKLCYATTAAILVTVKDAQWRLSLGKARERKRRKKRKSNFVEEVDEM